MKIGFIGLGIMGKPMVRNLMKAQHELFVYDISPKNVDLLVQEGAHGCASIEEVVASAQCIITMLPNSPQVETVVMGKDGILETSQEGHIIVDMSSIAPLASQKIGKACEAKGVRMLDCPVSGGEPKAIDGTLSIMCGGDKDLFDDVAPVLKIMGKDVTLCGTLGAGNTTKLANQIIVACNIAGLAEAFTLSKKAGVDPTTVFHAIKGGLAGSTVMNAKAPMMIEGNYNPGFKIDLHIKDLNNAIDTAHGVGSPVPLTVAVQEMFENLHFDGKGQHDHSGLAEYYAKISGTTIGDE